MATQFIISGDRAFNLAHIVSADYWPALVPMVEPNEDGVCIDGRPARLEMVLSSFKSDPQYDYEGNVTGVGVASEGYKLHGAEAERVWELLRSYQTRPNWANLAADRQEVPV